jgi:hypothetical protein
LKFIRIVAGDEDIPSMDDIVSVMNRLVDKGQRVYDVAQVILEQYNCLNLTV